MLSNKPLPARVAAVATVPAPPVKPIPVARPVPPAAPKTPAPEDRFEEHPFRRFFLYCALATLFVQLSVLPEVIAYVTNTNTYILYLVAPPALAGVVLMGGIRRTFRAKASYLWMAFFFWMVLAIPFSSWRGGSTQRVLDYGERAMIFLFLTAGLAMTWKDIRATFYTIAAAAAVNLATAKLFIEDVNGRVSLKASGTIGNSNDLAAHLLMVLPFVLFLVVSRGKPIIVRVAGLGLIAYGLWVILGTASRGALVALIVVTACMMIRASLMQQVALLVIGVLLTVGAIAVLPGQTLARLGALFGEEHKEADESADSRWYLFKKSVQYTVQHPVFGVGPDQFANYEGTTSIAEGHNGNWHATHNAFTQISSECGIPAFLFFVGGLAAACSSVLRTYRKAKREGYTEIANACFCYLLAMVGYLTALVFLAEAYSFKLPAMVGLSVALSLAAARQMKALPVTHATIPPIPARPQLSRQRTL
jgi:putative inorganic carbon (hco3(-)) transporter